jgi:AcrR family transcriptional regulator
MEAAEREFGAHGFSAGSLNVIAREAGVAKGSLFQYFEDKLDLVAYVSDQAGARVRAHMVEVAGRLREGRTFFEFLTELLEAWVDYFESHPRERALTAAVNLEADPAAREAVRSVVNRHYLEVLGPWLTEARDQGELRPDADLDALLALLLMIAPHLALAPFTPGLDPVMGLAAGGPEQPGLAIRRLVAPLAAAFGTPAGGLGAGLGPVPGWQPAQRSPAG